MGRTVSAVVTWGDTYLGVIGPFPVSVPWWAEAEPVVTHLREVVPVLVLRLLGVEGGEGGRDGHVTYHVAALDRPAPGLLEERPADHGVLNGPEELRSPWATLGGLNEVLNWASDALATAGRPLTGAAEQRRTWNLAALFRLPTGKGPVWLKTTPRFAADEASVIAAFARVDPTLVPPVIGAGPRRVLLEHLPGEDCWDASPQIITSAVQRLAAAQAALAGQPAGLLPGLPDRRAPVIAGQITALLDGEVASELSAGEVAAARGLLSRFARLDECGLPDTIVHGDFHPGNWRSGGGPPAVVDWADAHVGNPVLDGLRACDFLPAGRRPAAARAWIDAWASRIPGCEPARALSIAEPLAHLSYAVRYQEFLDGIEPSERIYHLGDPAAAIRAALRSALAEEVQQQGVDLVWGIQLQPVTRAVQALVPPRARHVLGGVGHLHFAQRAVPRAPDAHGRCLHRRQLNRRAHPGFGRDVGPVPVQAGGERAVRFQIGDHLIGVGVARTAEVSPVVVGQPALGDAGELEQQHVPRLLALLQGAAEGDRVADGQDDEAVHAAGSEGGEHPGQAGAPVVADYMGRADVLLGEDRHDIPGQPGHRVGLDRLGLVGAPVAAQVGDDDLEPGPGERRHLVPPQAPGVGKAVQQHDRAPLAGHLVLDTDPVDIHPAHTARFSRTGAGVKRKRPRRA